MLYDIDLCSTLNKVDPILEIYYTAAIWNIILKQTKVIHERPEIYKIKLLVPVWSGGAAQPKGVMFKHTIQAHIMFKHG